MKSFETLDRFITPDGQALTFHRRDGDFFVYLDGEELMSSRAPGSERALAELACAGLEDKPRVLIGGLGLGFTLRAALDVLPGGAEVVVAELFAKVIEWNHTWLAGLQAGALTDRRTRIEHADVWELVESGAPWNAILLDVDNGPEAWCFESQSVSAPGQLFSIRSAASPTAANWVAALSTIAVAASSSLPPVTSSPAAISAIATADAASLSVMTFRRWSSAS